MLTPDRINQLNEIFKYGDILKQDGAVEADEEKVTITFAVENDWCLRSIRFIYDGKIDPLNMICLLYELGVWVDTPRRLRSPIGDVLKQYRGQLTDPKVYIQTHVT